jgi:uncharacterized protein (TIGR03032 family)
VPNSTDASAAQDHRGLQMISSRGFTGWMQQHRLSLAVSTYQAGGVLFLGTKPDASIALYVSAFDRAMGLWSDGSSLWVATTLGLWRFENTLPAGMVRDGYDRCFVPRQMYVTGDVDAHDLVVDGTGRPVFVNTRFNCLATVDDEFSFRPIWRPEFVTDSVAEDRCHLNGLALEDGQPRYVTLVAPTNVADGWRNRRRDGGQVIDITNNSVFADGLSMPHSPRLHEGKLWLLNAGTGFLGYIDRQTHKFEPVTFVPGFARGLCIVGQYAVVGLSKPRGDHSFQELALQENLKSRQADPWCGVQIIDLLSGTVVEWLRLEGVVQELFEVVALRDSMRPQAMSLHTPNIHEYFCLPQGENDRKAWIPPVVKRPTQQSR